MNDIDRKNLEKLLGRVECFLSRFRVTSDAKALYLDVSKALASLQSDERVEEAAKPKTLSNARAPKPGQGIPQSVAGQRLDPEFLAETMGRVEEVEGYVVHFHPDRYEFSAYSLHDKAGRLVAGELDINEARKAYRDFAKRIVQPTGSEK